MSRTKKSITYPVLEAKIASRGIKKKDIAEKIGISARTLSFKLSEAGRFSAAEQQVIAQMLDSDIDTLFKEKMHSNADKTSERIPIPVSIDGKMIDTITVLKQ